MNPLFWIKEKLVPAVGKKKSKEEIDAAKQQAAEAGKTSVFEQVNAPTPAAGQPLAVGKTAEKTITSPAGYIQRKPRKPRPTEVSPCCILFAYGFLTWTGVAQILYGQLQTVIQETEHAGEADSGEADRLCYSTDAV